jgi:hypothetical protein
MAAGEILPRAEVSRRLSESEWQCRFVRDFATAAMWRTAYGFYFSVPHDCTEEDLTTSGAISSGTESGKICDNRRVKSDGMLVRLGLFASWRFRLFN